MKTGEKATSFLPAIFHEWIGKGRLVHRFLAVVAFADVSGFTAMSERLSAIGKEGAETLTAILNSYFTTMIGRIERNGGFVGKFGGDAMTIFFPAHGEKGLPAAAKRAVSTSIELQRAMSEFQHIETRSGIFSLGMKVGVAAGKVLFQVVGPENSGREYLLAGHPLDMAAEAEHYGDSGDIIVTSKVVDLCGVCGDIVEDNFIRLNTRTSLPKFTRPRRLHKYQAHWAEQARSFIDPSVLSRIKLGLDSVGEIRRVSVLFLSFSGLDYDEDPQVTKKLDAIYNWVYSLAQQYNGAINKVDMGDKGSKMILTFGAPTAHENDAAHAVHCGLELVKGREEFNRWGLNWRLGIATGVTFAGEVGATSRQEYTVMGSTVNLSARLMSKCEPGQLLVDETTYSKTHKYFEYSESKQLKLKGISLVIPAYEPLLTISRPGHKVSGKIKPLIGREVETAQLTSILDNVTSSKSFVVFIQGEAGTGKSRLSQESIRLGSEKGFRSAGGEALSYASKTPYLVWLSILRNLMELSPSAKQEENLARLEELVMQADSEHQFRLPLLASLFGISCPDNPITRHFDAKLRQENIFDFLVQYFKFLSAETPIALYFEDAQWINKNSLELIAYLVRNLRQNPIVFVIVCRPFDDEALKPICSQMESDENVVTITIREFDRDLTSKFALSCLNAEVIESDLLDCIFDASHGNASFTEELINNLEAQNKIRLIKVKSKIRAEKIGSLKDVEVPDSLNSLIMSQLDRLGPEAKLTLKVAAVIGRRFALDVLEGAYPITIDREQLINSIEELSLNDLINSQEDLELLNYIFKNLLTRDVAYDSLLFAHRREYHRRIGLLLEELHSDTVNEWCEELGWHFYHTEEHEKAIKYLRKSGEKAIDLYANESAEAYFTMALDHASIKGFPEARFFILKLRAKVNTILGKLDLRKLDLDEMLIIADHRQEPRWKALALEDLAFYYMRINDLVKMKEVIDEALSIIADRNEPYLTINLTEKMGACMFNSNNFKEALSWFQQSLENAERIKDVRGIMTGLTNCGVAYKALSMPEKAIDYYQRSVELSRNENNKKSEAVTLGNIGVLHHQRGDIEHALATYTEALEIARSIGWKEVQARNLGGLAQIYQSKGDREKALDLYQEKLSIENQMGYRQGEMYTLGNIGTWHAQDGNYDEAIQHYQKALQIAHDLNIKSGEPLHMLNIGVALHRRGDLQASREMLEQALTKSIEIDYKQAEDYARRYLGFVLIDLGDLSGANEQFNAAMAIAEKMGSKLGLAASKVGLGVIAMLQGEGRSMLDEGIEDTRSLQDAEHYIKGKVSLAKILLKQGGAREESLEILKSALAAAKKTGLGRDVKTIEPMIAELEGDFK